jgi:pilus assembly protein Flp/PilA
MLSHLIQLLQTFRKGDKGVSAIEYGLIAALIAVVIIVAVILVGQGLSQTFSNVGGHVQQAGS